MRWASRPRDERGAIAIVMAASLAGVLVAVALVLDFGIIRVDRQVDKSAADAATLAGLQGLMPDGASDAHPYAGVCTALRYLKVNNARFASISESTASYWSNGAGTPAGASGCSSSALQLATCKPGDQSTWAVFAWSGSWQGTALSVRIQSGYSLSGSGWAEDTLPASTADAADDKQGCDQLAVVITQSRKPGLGSLATSSDLTSSIRSVGRAQLGPGGYAPALLLLKQHGCGVLTTGTSAGGSLIRVIGAAASNGLTQPGTIHSDSDGVGCGSNENLFTGNAASSIVAYAAPQSYTNQTTADLSKPGRITSYASATGLSGSVIRDSATYVCGAAGIYPTGQCPGQDVVGKDRVYREPVDKQYLMRTDGTGGVKQIRDDANAVFNLNFSTAPGWTVLSNNNCTFTQSDVAALTAASKVYFSCNSNKTFNVSGNVTVNAGTVVFSTDVAPSATLSMPNATKVYVVGRAGADAIALSNGGTFSMHTMSSSGSSNLSSGLCADAPTGSASNKAVLVIQNGDFKQTGGSLQLCYTTVLMMGGRSDACLPSAPTQAAPNPLTPCGGAVGSGQLTQTGGDVDWTAPNQYEVMLNLDGSPDPTRQDSWKDPNGPEDLALWSESGTAGGSKFQMTGGGNVHLVGVLMTPNAEPFTLSGQFVQRLINAQYVASSVSLSSNNTSITMQVDPNAAVTVGQLAPIGLVR